MRAVFVLALLLSVASPPVAWSAMADSSPKAGASVSLASTTSAASQLVRGTAKAEKSLSGGWLSAPEAPAFHQEFEGSVGVVHQTSQPPNLSLDCPPLTPRPPPLA
jgi:hypothetical protein